MALVNGELGPKEVVYPEEFVVGREFCLQYYTILTKRTDNIHRFYDEDSQMTRGSSEITLTRNGAEADPMAPAVGQKEIHKRMMAENLVNAKVKVLQFDVQKVGGDSKLLVIQVCGELTNDDGPMRRFMESFVLKRTDAKKCYVVNNIFRFQDQVFCNGMEDNGADGFNSANMGDGVSTAEAIKEVSVPADDHLTSHSVTANDDVLDSCVEPVGKSDSVIMNEESEGSTRYDIVESSAMVDVAKTEECVEIHTEEKRVDIDKLDESPDVPADNSVVLNNSAPNSDAGRVSAPSGRSWANLVSQGIGGPAKPVVVAPIMRAPRPAPAPVPPPVSNTEPQEHSGPASTDGRGPKGRESTPSTNLDTGNGSTGPAPLEKTKYPDNVQVFVGNIPITMKSEVLKDFFNSYGDVADVRINVSKSNGRLPNFGFVIFKSAETVQHVLTKRPIFIEGHRLNVEEKKPNGNRSSRQSASAGGSGGVGSAPRSNGFGPRPRRA